MAVGGLLLVAIVVGLAVFTVLRRRRQQQQAQAEGSEQHTTQPCADTPPLQSNIGNSSSHGSPVKDGGALLLVSPSQLHDIKRACTSLWKTCYMYSCKQVLQDFRVLCPAGVL